MMHPILQTDTARHVENLLYPAGVEYDRKQGFHRSLCGLMFTLVGCKIVKVPLIPSAAICPDCVAIARRWYAPDYFEPFDAVQRRRLLAVLERDLAAVA